MTKFLKGVYKFEYRLTKRCTIGVFDSGVGGLTVVREIMQNLPNENLVYFGDTRVPYGSKSVDTIIRFSKQIVRFLETKKVKAIVIACNTVSALALDILRVGNYVPGHRSSKTRLKSCGGSYGQQQSRYYRHGGNGQKAVYIQSLSNSISRIFKCLQRLVLCLFRLWKRDL